jgi:hypothetical protein
MIRPLALALAPTSCTTYHVDVDAVVAETLEYWDQTVGYRKPLTIEILDDHPTRAGECIGWDYIAVYLNRLHPDYVAEQLRHVLLHELVHAHLTCSPDDHSSDPKSIMYPHPSLIQELDAETLRALKQ